MIDVDYYYHAPRATLTMSYSEIESLVAYLKNFENRELPETIREEILPRMVDFLADNF